MMTAYQGQDRRDALSPLLQLGQTLVDVRRRAASGRIEVRSDGQSHSLEITRGTISFVRGPGVAASCSDRAGTVVLRLARDLFLLRRPLVEWQPAELGHGVGHIDPESVVISGVLARRELFDPVAIADRIPTAVLQLTEQRAQKLRHLPLLPEERDFLQTLRVPTPVTLAMWKRGLCPKHAAALLTGLNLLGAFADQWAPADLPRNGAVRRLKAVVDAHRPDHEILNVDPEAEEPEIDSAYRRIALTLHPDRSGHLPDAEKREAAETFARVSEAYDRLKRTRRQRRVREGATVLARVSIVKGVASEWEPLLQQARQALREGSRDRARAFALKAMSLHPPEHVKQWLIGILAA